MLPKGDTMSKWLDQYAALEAAATAANGGGTYEEWDAAKEARDTFLRNTAPKLARLKAAVDALDHEFTEAGIRELRAARAELDNK